MTIDFNLNSEYEINQDIIIPKEYYQNSEVKDIKKLHIEGKFSNNQVGEVHAIAKISGTMILLDAISNEEVEYPFLIEYDDILEETSKNEENKLDLFEFLWENIVLEIPLKFTKVEDLSKFHGDGWKVVSEEEHAYANNPFQDLLKNFDKKE